MKIKKLPSLLSLLLAIPVAAAAIYLGFKADTLPAGILRQDSSACLAASGLVDSLSAGDFQQAGDYLQGSPSLFLPQKKQEDAMTLLWNYYCRSLSGQLIGEPYVCAQGYFQDAVFYTADLDGLTRRMKELAPGLVAERIESAQEPSQVYNEDLSLREELIDSVLCSAARKAIQEKPQPRECRVRLQLVYEDTRWLIRPDQALLNILAGNMENG